MTENTDQNITVLIAGNPDAQAGESVLLNINNSPLKSEELGKTFYDSITSDYYIELKHCKEYIAYIYVANPATVHSAGASRPGMFWIGVTIPKGKKVENTAALIFGLKDMFQKEYMQLLSDNKSYEYKNMGYNGTKLKEIVSRYKLIDSEFPDTYVEMDSNQKLGTITLKSDDENDRFEHKITKFLDDTQFPEFKNYSAIIVAKGLSAVPSIRDLEVPRLVDYVVKCSDGETLKSNNYTINRKNPVFEGTLSKDVYHDSIHVKFNLNEISNIDNDLEIPFTISKDSSHIIVKGHYTPKKFKIGLIIINNKIKNIKEVIESLCIIDGKGKECKIQYDKNFDHFLEFDGTDVKNALSIKKRSDDDIFDFAIENPEIDNTTQTIRIEVTEFKGIEISGIPTRDNSKKRKVYLNIKDKECDFEIGTTYGGGKYLLDLDTIANKYNDSFNRKDIIGCKYDSDMYESYNNDTSSYKYDDNGILEITLTNIQEKKQIIKQDKSKETDNTSNNKITHTLRIFNKVDNSTIHLDDVCLNNKPIDIEKEIQNISQSTDSKTNTKKKDNYVECKISDCDQNTAITIKIKDVETNDSKHKRKKNKDIEVLQYEYNDLKITSGDNDKVNIYTINIIDDDIKYVKKRNTFLSKFISIIIVFIVFIFGLMLGYFIGTYLNNDKKNKTEMAYNTLREYYDLMVECNKKLTFNKVTEINNWIDSISSIDNKDNPIKEDTSFKAIQGNINYYVNAAESLLKKKKIITNDLYKKIPDGHFCENLKKNLAPYSGDDEYKIFVEWIKEKKIEPNFGSFDDVLKLYKDNKKGITEEIAKQNKIAELTTTCTNYRTHMTNCSDSFTFDTVFKIKKWFDENKDNTDINAHENFKFISDHISHYVEAAEAIKSIQKNYCGKGSITFLEYIKPCDEVGKLNSVRWNDNVKKLSQGSLKKCCEIMTASAQYDKNNEYVKDKGNKDYELFVQLILTQQSVKKLAAIGFSEVKSFYDVIKLYEKNKKAINKANNQNNTTTNPN